MLMSCCANPNITHLIVFYKKNMHSVVFVGSHAMVYVYECVLWEFNASVVQSSSTKKLAFSFTFYLHLF